MSGRVPTDVYETASAEVEHALESETLLLVCRAVGRVPAQIAICRAFVQVAGNALACLTDHEEAESFHRQRASYHRQRATKAMPIARRAR